MVTDNPLIKSCISRTPPRPKILWKLLGLGWSWAGAGWELAGSWLGAGGELAGNWRGTRSWLELAGSWLRAITTRNPEHRAESNHYDFSRRLGPAGGILGLACGYSGQAGEVAQIRVWGHSNNSAPWVPPFLYIKAMKTNYPSETPCFLHTRGPFRQESRTACVGCGVGVVFTFQSNKR